MLTELFKIPSGGYFDLEPREHPYKTKLWWWDQIYEYTIPALTDEIIEKKGEQRPDFDFVIFIQQAV